MENKLRIFRCGLYARVSTDRQANQLEGSLDLQMRLMQDAVASKAQLGFDAERWEVADTYVDGGESGKDQDRPELQRLKRDIVAGRINSVIFCKIDRLSRNLRDFFDLVEFFQEHKVHVSCLKEQFDTSTAMGRAMLSITLVFAQLERETTAERTSESMQGRAEKGLHNGGRIWGYNLDPARRGYLIVNPDEAAVIKMMFNKYLEMNSVDEVVRYLHSIGIKRPEFMSRRNKLGGGKPVHKQTLLNLLSNPRYVGLVPHKGELYPGKHEAIVDKVVYDRVQEKRASHPRNRRPRVSKDGTVAHHYLLRGRIRCGKCGAMLTPKPGNGYPYYVCTRVDKSCRTRCNMPALPAQAIEEHVLDRLRQISTAPELVAELYLKASSYQTEEVRLLESDKQAMQRRKEEIESALKPWIQRIFESGPEALSSSIRQRIADQENLLMQVSKDLDEVTFKIDRLQAGKCSIEMVAESYKSLGTILSDIEPEALSKIIPLVIDGIEWTPTADPENPGKYVGGEYKMLLFESPLISAVQPNLLTEDGLISSQGQDWLPR